MYGMAIRGLAALQVDGPDYSQPLRLRGHQKEVTGVAWCPTNLFNVATCSDDHTLRVWKSHRQLPQPSGQDTEVGCTPSC